jgi:hypothetical protein
MKKSIFTITAALLISSTMFGQFRDGGKDGINVFETPKTEKEFKGIKTTIGGGFTQSFQSLEHSNKAVSKIVSTVEQNKLTPLRAGFNLASANLMLKTQLADGVALNMELYLASRHHNETWVKGGFIQFDKLPFLKMDFVDNIMKYTTIKMGQMEVNYGDAHFRRTDGGNAIYNPFVENHIIDEFSTEIGVEADINYNGFIGVLSLTNGLLKGNISVIDSTFNTDVTPKTLISAGKNNPAIIAKLGYDKQFTDDLRARLTGSVYYNAGASNGTLLGGDRTGSNYFGIMDYAAPSTANFSTGRYNPGFSDKITGLMCNLFVKFKGIESFTTIESLSGRSRTEKTGERKVSQIATDLLYRFGKDENFWVGVRYNVATAEQYLGADLPAVSAIPVGSPAGTAVYAFPAQTKGMYDITIDRLAVSAGWFITKNVMAKLEYTNQNYGGFAYNDIRSMGNFKGVVAQAVIGF